MSTKTQSYIQGAEEMRELCARLIEQLYIESQSRQATPTVGWAQLVRCLPVGGVLTRRGEVGARNFSPPDIPFGPSDGEARELERREAEYKAKLKADYAQQQRHNKRRI